MWKCRKCGYIIKDGSLHVGEGFCPKCKEYFILERFDPLFSEDDKK